MLEGTYNGYICLTVAAHNIDLSVLNTSLSDLCHAPFLLYMLKTGFGFCSLLRSVALGGVLSGRCILKALALSLIWYLGSALMPLLYFGNHLMETINNYTFFLFSSERFSVEETQNGTFTTFFCVADIYSLVTITP